MYNHQPIPKSRRMSTFSKVSASFRRKYSSRKAPSTIRTHDLPLQDNANKYHPWALVWGAMLLIAPICHLYCFGMVIRELCLYFPETLLESVKWCLPSVAMWIRESSSPSSLLEAWCFLEALFYILLKGRIWWLQFMKCPIEASLSIAPLMDEDERERLFHAMMDMDAGMNIEQWLCGWFFDSPLQEISKYDVRDFVTWCLFEGRRLEHLIPEELAQLERFVHELEYRISIHLYGIQEHGDETDDDVDDDEDLGEDKESDNKRKENVENVADGETSVGKQRANKQRPMPKQEFSFPENDVVSEEPSTFFSNLYEKYRRKREQYADFHPLQEFRNIIAWTTAEESALLELLRKGARRRSSLLQFLEKHAKDSGIISSTRGEGGGGGERRRRSSLLALSVIAFKNRAEESARAFKIRAEESAMAIQRRAGRSVGKIRALLAKTAQNAIWNGTVQERLELAKYINRQRQRLEEQLRSSRVLWNKMRSMASHVPSHQKAVLLRQITATHEALEQLESRARDRLVRVTGFARQRLQTLFPQKEPPKPFAKYSSDPLLGIATYPLGLHLTVLGATEVPLRVMMHQRGFQRFTVGRISYYYHPGSPDEEDDCDDDVNPTVFIHGIGVGLICYIPLVDELLKRSKRPIFLPEIPYVTAFRPWQTTSAVLPPDVVCSSLTAMLALHGYSKAVFCGHSFGTSWLSYMVKYARSAVAAVLFLDPICFALHVAVLTKQWVYVQPDPGTIAYIVRTDLMVNLCIQRAFPWAWKVLFVEQLQGLPWAVFLSEKDMLVPAQRVEHYLRSNGCNVMDFDQAEFHMQQDKTVCVFRGEAHGGWVERPSATCPQIAECAQILHDQAKRQQQ